MKTKTLKHFFFIVFLIILAACSTRKDTFLARNSHALSTKYNIDYNGQIALDKGIQEINTNTRDNFWKILPVERMQISDDGVEKTKNANFELAEAKATKAIQKHSMNIDGNEKNSQMDEAYLLLGKARYYDQRFIPSLDAFNYILYKYSNSDKIYQSKIWREKANMRLGNDAQVIKNISKLLDDKKLKKQDIADANALLTESFLNIEEKDSAIAKLKIAENYTGINNERARYRFILGQLYQELGKKDSAIYYYQSVIDMKRKAERLFTIQAYAKKAQLFDFENGNQDAFVETYNELVDDRENRPFLDIIYYEMGVFFDKNKEEKEALEFYNASLERKSLDPYLIASNYRNIGNMYFRNTDYTTAAKYYDSTLVKMDAKTREYIHIKKVRKDLDEVIEFESIAKSNDSILNVLAMTDADRILYFEKHIEKLKAIDEEKRLLEEKEKEKQENIARNNLTSSDDPAAIDQKPGTPPRKSFAPPTATTTNDGANSFYFYNPTTVAFGKTEFKKKWGNRALGGNWRTPAGRTDVDQAETTTDVAKDEVVEEEIPEQYTTAFYIDQLPKLPESIANITKDRNFAYYQLGIIYKEKFKEYDLASHKLEKLLTLNPEEKLVLPAWYNLYKIYQITDVAKAEEVKNRITSQYPDSRYAQIINNKNPASNESSPEAVYGKLYKDFEDEQLELVLSKVDGLIIDFSGDEIVPKLELLKANAIGKLRGLEAYKTAMQFVVDNYPTSEEGKKALEILTTQIPTLEKMNFTTTDTKSWRILYKVGKKEDKNTKALEEKLKKFFNSENVQRLSYTFDIYSEKENFIVVQGIKSGAYANSVAFTLRDDKKYKITEPFIVISNENYKVIQIKKNLTEYLTLPKAVLPNSSGTATPESLKINPQTGPEQLIPAQTTTGKADSNKKAAGTKPPTAKQQTEVKDNPNPNSPPKQ